MFGKWLKKRVGLILLLFFCFTIFVFGQDKQDEQDKQLRAEILSIYKSKGEQGLGDFVKKQKDKISNKFIVDFAETGANYRKKEWLRISEIMAENKKNEKNLADVYLRMGKYYLYISDNKSANDFLEKSLTIYKKLNALAGQGDVFFCQGEIYLYTGANDNALKMYENALLLFKKSKALKGQGSVYYRKGTIYHDIGDIVRAEEMYDKALSLFEKVSEPMGQANVLESKGKLYFLVGNNSKALEVFDRALLLFKKAEFPSGQGNVYHFRGYVYYHTGEYKKAFEMYDKALFFFEKIGSADGQGNVYLSKGDIYFLTGLNSDALEMYRRALTFYTKVKQSIGQGNVYRSMGEVNLRIGEYSKAQKMYDKALHFSKKGRDFIGQGNVYMSKGTIYQNTGKYSKALEMFDKSLILYKKSGNIRGQGIAYFNIGEIYLITNNNSKALELFEKALFYFIKTKQPLQQGNVYKRKGDIYAASGKYFKAQKMYDKAISSFKRVQEPIGQGNIYGSKGDIYYLTGNNSKALELYHKALSFFEEAKYTIGQGFLYIRIADIYLKNENNSKALEMYEKALALFTKISNIEPEALILHGKAKTLLKMGKWDEALTFFEKGIANLEKVRRYTAFTELKRAFMEKVYRQYEGTVLFMLENKFYDKGFKYAESMKSRVFLDQMAEGLVKLGKGLKPGLKEERERLVGKLSALSRQMQETGGKEEKKLLELKEEYRRVESEFDDLLIKIRLENPLYAEVNYPQPVSVKDLQKDVLKEGETLLSYFISQEKSYAFIISKDNFNVEQLKVKENEIKGLVYRYLPAVKENNINNIKRYGSLLYEKLFKPLEKYLDKNNDIIIVPMGELETIPFESLVIDKKKTGPPVYLLERYRVKYVQGATLLSILRKYYTGDSTSNGFVGFGDPVYDYENFKQSKPEKGSVTRSPGDENSVENEIKEIHRDRYARAGGIMNRLPQSGEEIQTIARLFEKESLESVIHLRDQASEENAKAANMKDFAYIHFSCHGLLNDDFQSLVLSQTPPDKSSEDGYFTLNEIMNCDYNAKLVVLSACETGKGKMYKGEGVTGLTRAIMYAGTPAVVAGLWKVDDTATKELMVTFYKNMLEKNMDKVEALRQAKFELIKTQRFSSPYFWSPFIMYGE